VHNYNNYISGNIQKSYSYSCQNRDWVVLLILGVINFQYHIIQFLNI
jgi:hypothetical protein